jgi:hypothetical protein
VVCLCFVMPQMLIAYKHLVFVESNVVSSHAPKVGV